MALDNQIDNDGIKKGLGLVISQLIQSNKKLDTQETGNIFKELKQNNRLTEKLLSEKLKDDTPKERILDQAPEIAADILISRKETSQEQQLSEGSDRFLNTIAVTLFDTFRANSAFQAESLRIAYLTNQSTLENVETLGKNNENIPILYQKLGEEFMSMAMKARTRQKNLLNQIKKDLSRPLKESIDASHKIAAEGKKEEKKTLKNIFKKQTDSMKGMFKNLGDKLDSKPMFKKLGKGILGVGKAIKKRGIR